MSKKFLPTDDYYKKLICESNKLGNALLANLVSEKIIQKKRKITKINFSSEIVNYKNEVDKIRQVISVNKLKIIVTRLLLIL